MDGRGVILIVFLRGLRFEFKGFLSEMSPGGFPLLTMSFLLLMMMIFEGCCGQQ